VITGNKIGQGDGKTFAGTGVWLRNIRDISVVDNELCFLGDGVDSLDCQNILVERNHFHDIASNATFHSSFKGLKVRKNVITDMRIQPDSSHPDAIQWASTGDTGRSSDLEVSGNVITRGTGDAVQGAFGESVDNALIYGNAMQGTMLNGISVSDSSNVEIRDNFGQGMTRLGHPHHRPWLVRERHGRRQRVRQLGRVQRRGRGPWRQRRVPEQHPDRGYPPRDGPGRDEGLAGPARV
jgi:hypothetical protein